MIVYIVAGWWEPRALVITRTPARNFSQKIRAFCNSLDKRAGPRPDRKRSLSTLSTRSRDYRACCAGERTATDDGFLMTWLRATMKKERKRVRESERERSWNLAKSRNQKVDTCDRTLVHTFTSLFAREDFGGCDALLLELGPSPAPLRRAEQGRRKLSHSLPQWHILSYL